VVTAPRKASLCTAVSLVVVALALWPALAVADPPVLKLVTLEPNQNHPTTTWALPAGVTSQFVQTSRSSDVDENGYFTSVQTFNTLDRTQTSFFDEYEFSNGVYYVHVAGHDQKCKGGVCPPIQFSEVMSFQVPGVAGAGPGGALPPTGGGPGPDKVVPFQRLTFPAVQDVDKLFVRAQMSEAGTLRASATVSVAGASRVYKFKTVSRSVGANVLATLRLKLAKSRLKRVRRALRRGKRLKAKVTVTATDKAGNKRAQKATIRLKR
jgi:hypothetical protein